MRRSFRPLLAVSLAAAIVASLLPGSEAAAKRRKVRAPHAANVEDAAAKPSTTPIPPLADEEVGRFLALWPAFEGAMKTLSIVEPRPDVDPDGLAQADVALATDTRMRASLESLGATPDEFLLLYRRVSGAWWAMTQAEDHASADAALDAEVADLEKVSGKDSGARRAADEMRKHREDLEHAEDKLPGEIPGASIETVRRHRAALARIFG